MANRFKRKRRDPISILEGPLIVVWKTRVDKGKTIKRLLEKSTQEMMEVWTKVMALERGNNGQRVKKCFRHKKTQDSYVTRAYSEMYFLLTAPPGQLSDFIGPRHLFFLEATPSVHTKYPQPTLNMVVVKQKKY